MGRIFSIIVFGARSPTWQEAYIPMEEAVRIALVAISYAMILFLISSGLSLVLGVMGILNLAHGSLYMVGAYIGLTLSKQLGSFWLVAFVSGLALGLLGLLLERVFLSRLHRHLDEQMLLTTGFVYILANLALWIWGPYGFSSALPPLLNSSVAIGSLIFPVYRIVLLSIGLLIAALLWWFQEKTRAGAVLRAGIDDKQMTMAMGINYGLVCSEVFFLGAFIAGFTGFIGTPLMGAQSEMGFPILLLAVSVVIVGGVGRVEGTLLGAIIVGFIDSLGKTFFPDFALFTVYVIFILMILLKPAGLLGRKKF